MYVVCSGLSVTHKGRGSLFGDREGINIGGLSWETGVSGVQNNGIPKHMHPRMGAQPERSDLHRA